MSFFEKTKSLSSPSSSSSSSSVSSSTCSVYSFDSLLRDIPVSEEELLDILPAVGAKGFRGKQKQNTASDDVSISYRSVIQFPKEVVIEGFQSLFQEMIKRNWKKSTSISKKDYLSSLLLVSHQFSQELVDFLFSLLSSKDFNGDLLEVNVERIAKISALLLLNPQHEKVRVFSFFFSVFTVHLHFHLLLYFSSSFASLPFCRSELTLFFR
jgi:hypothetical protein